MTIQHTHVPRVPDNASEQTLGADYDGDTLRGGRTSARTATHVDTTPPDSLSLARPNLPKQHCSRRGSGSRPERSPWPRLPRKWFADHIARWEPLNS